MGIKAKIANLVDKYYLVVVVNVALFAIAGSLYFSEVLGLAPCTFCWYQRILMYPLLPIALIAYLTKDQRVFKYILALAIPGTILALYQYILQKTTTSESVAVCTGGVSCSAIDFELLGFITIPFLSFVAFAVITAICLSKYYLLRKRHSLSMAN